MSTQIAGRRKILIIPCTGKSSRFNSATPKYMMKIDGITALERLISNVQDIFTEIIVVIDKKINLSDPSYSTIKKKFRNLHFAFATVGKGDGDALFQALIEYINYEDDLISVIWGDVFLNNISFIEQTLDSFISNDKNDFLFPSFYKKSPYVFVIRDSNGKIRRFGFSKRDEYQSYGETDMCFFVFNIKCLTEIFQYRNTIFDEKLGEYTTYNLEFNLLESIPYLVSKGLRINSLEIGDSSDFFSFNTLEEFQLINQTMSTK